MQTVWWIVLAVVVILLVVVAVRTFTFGRRSEEVPSQNKPAVDVAAAAEHLAEAVRSQTFLAGDNAAPDREAFVSLWASLEKMYPRLHAALERETVGELALLYTWKGTRPELEPVLFAAHQDVVPVDPATLSEWKHLPFAGEIAEGFVWGRGTLDCKNQLIGVMEAVESLLLSGFQPERTIYLAFGHDEETGGEGAKLIVNLLKSRGVRLSALVDEGGEVVKDMLPGVKTPVGLVGVAEKGYLTLELSVECPPGHSSMPPAQTAIGIISKAVTRLEATPMPGKISMFETLFRAVGSSLPLGMRAVFANLWLFGPLVKPVLEKAPQTNAMLRTSTAVTVINGGIKDNILPRQAKVTVNFRLLPGDSQEDVIRHVREVVADERVKIEKYGKGGWESSPVSPITSRFYQELAGTARQVFEGAEISPYLMLGATDARSYTPICDNVFRFSPVTADKEDLERVHGINERLSLEDVERMVQFFSLLMRAWSK